MKIKKKTVDNITRKITPKTGVYVVRMTIITLDYGLTGNVHPNNIEHGFCTNLHPNTIHLGFWPNFILIL